MGSSVKFINNIVLEMVASPLEQFEMYFIIEKLLFLNLYISNSTVILLFVVYGINRFFQYYYFNSYLIPRGFQNVVEQIYSFLLNLVRENLTMKAFKYFPFVFMISFLLICLNVIGMVPFSFTITAHLSVTFFLALSIFIGINLIGIKKHKLKFFNLFLPGGAPLVLAPLLIVIEFISYIARVFSLSIRLFANMMSGHTLMKILASFAWVLLLLLGFYWIYDIPVLLIILIITGLELTIAFLQAYVFSVLICIYLNDAIELH